MAKGETTKSIYTSKKSSYTVHLVGTSALILCKKSRSFEREEIWKQSHGKGDIIPEELNSKQHYNLWEKLITSITWENPITEHDRYEDYTEDEYRQLMKDNRPCILSNAFEKSFSQAFKSFGYKEATGKDGTDFTRCMSVQRKTPVDITAYKYDMHLVPNNTVSHTNVLSQCTVFEGWSCDMHFDLVESVLPIDTVLAVIGDAGQFLGIGARRGSDGFGRYTIESVS